MLKINDKIEIFPNKNGATIYDKKRHLEYTIGESELNVVKFLLEHSVENIEQIQIDETYEYINDTVDTLKKYGIIENTTCNRKKINLCLCVLNYDKLKIIDKYDINSIYKAAISLLPIGIVLTVVLFYVKKIDIALSNFNHSLPKSSIIYFCISCYLSLVLHEIYHAIFAKKFGSHVVEVGFMWKVFCPCLYLRIVGLPICTRKQRILVYSGGLYCHTTIFIFSLFLKTIFQKYDSIDIVLNAVGAMNLFLIAINSLPLFQLDGHKIYKEILNSDRFVDCREKRCNNSNSEIILLVSNLSLTIVGTIITNVNHLRLIGIVMLLMSLVIWLICIFKNRTLKFCMIPMLVFYVIQYGFMITNLIQNEATVTLILLNSIVFMLIANVITLYVSIVCYFFLNTKFYKEE